MKKTAIIAAMLLLALASGSIYAQTHTAQNDSMVARGWTYVRSFDSSYDVGISAAYGDTLLIGLGDIRAGKPSGTFVSLDGGVTLDHQFTFLYGDGTGFLFYNDPTYIEVGANGDSIFLTTDLGQSYRKFPANGQFHFLQTTLARTNVWIDPTDNGTSYIEWGSPSPSTGYLNGRYIIRTTDTGKTWTQLDLPYSHYDGEGIVNRQMLMDVRQHGLWYTMVTDEISGEINWYKTTDNGATFERWNGMQGTINVTVEAGVGYAGEIREPWGPDPVIPRGVETWNGDSANNHEIRDWADSLVPGIPDTLRTYNGNLFGIPIFYYFPSNPDFMLLPIDKEHQTENGAPIDSIRNWWFYSTDGGESFVKIWDDTTHAEFSIDKRNPKILWAITPPDQWGDTGTYSIYKREMPQVTSGVERSANESGTLTQVRLYSSRIELTGFQNSLSSIEIFDILGRRVFASSNTQPSNGTIILSFPHILSSGVYFISVSSSQGEVFRSKDDIPR